MGALFTPPAGYPITLTQGRSYDYFGKLAVSWTTFGGGQNDGYSPDVFIPFVTQNTQFINLTLDGYMPSSSATTLGTTSTVEYSFNGNTVHGELGTGVHNIAQSFPDRVICLVWFRVKSGSSGTISVSIQAYGNS